MPVNGGCGRFWLAARFTSASLRDLGIPPFFRYNDITCPDGYEEGIIMNSEEIRTAHNVLDELAEIESRLADYYEKCAEAFITDREIWMGLQIDEQSHAELVVELKSIMIHQPEAFELGRVGLPALKTYKKGIEEQIVRLDRREILRKNALFIARDFENTLIEKAFYTALHCGLPEYLELVGRIDSETERHRQKLDAYIKDFPLD